MGKLNNIDDAIRNSFDNFEVPFDASQWSLLENNLDNPAANDLTSFDEKVKETLTNHSAPYNAAAWTAVESQLAVATVSYTKWFVAAGVIGLISAGVYFFYPSETKNSVEENEKIELAENKNKPVENITNKSSIENKDVKSTDAKIGNDAEIENAIVETPIDNSNNSVNNSQNSSNNQNNNHNNTQNVITNNVIQNPNVIEPIWSFSSPIINGNNEMCEGQELKLSTAEMGADVDLQWFLNGVLVGDGNEIILKNLMAGIHEIELVYSANKNQSWCAEPVKKTSQTLTVKESPVVDFNYAQVGDAAYPEMKFNIINKQENVNYVWMMDNKSFTGEEIMYLFKNKGYYPVQLLAETTNGCSRTENKNIEISDDYNLLAPIAFTPNSDGHNDVFIPVALTTLNLPFKLFIYDRQEGLVYQTSRSDAPWDGRNMSTGENCNQGAYQWIVELVGKDGKTEQYRGTITILK